jgi:hypothetical protein
VGVIQEEMVVQVVAVELQKLDKIKQVLLHQVEVGLEQQQIFQIHL